MCIIITIIENWQKIEETMGYGLSKNILFGLKLESDLLEKDTTKGSWVSNFKTSISTGNWFSQ